MADTGSYGTAAFSLLFWTCGGLHNLGAERSPEEIVECLTEWTTVFGRIVARFGGQIASGYLEPMLGLWEEKRPVSRRAFDAARELVTLGAGQGADANVLVSHGQCVYHREGGKITVFGGSLNRGLSLSADLTRRVIRLGVDSLVIEDCPWRDATRAHGDVYDLTLRNGDA